MSKKLIVAVFALCGFCLVGRAGDSGDLVFPDEFGGATRLELVYENVRRGMRVTSESPAATRDVSANSVFVRYQSGIVPNARLDFDLGGLASDGSGYRLRFGMGLRYLALDHGPWRIGAFGQLRYASDVKDRMRLGTNDNASVTFDWLEADAGVLASQRFRISDHAAIVPYAGPVLSVAHLSGKARDTGGSDSFRAKDKWPIGVAGGVGLEFNGVNSIRLEMRVFDKIGASVGAAFAF